MSMVATTRSTVASTKWSPISFTQPVGSELIIEMKSVAMFPCPRVEKRKRPGEPDLFSASFRRSASFAEFPASDSGSQRQNVGRVLEDTPLEHSRRANEAVGSTTTVIQQHLTSFALQ